MNAETTSANNSTKPLCWRLFNAATNLVLPLAHIVMAFSLFGFGASIFFLFEWCSHFRLLYAAFFLVYLIPLLINRRWKLASLVAGFLAVNALTIVPLYAGRVHVENPKNTLTVMQANVNRSNLNFDKFADAVARENPDVVCILEMAPAWKQPMEQKLVNYPYRHTEPRDDCFGVGVYSRVPLIDAQTKYFGTSGAPTVTCEVGTRSSIDLFFTHAMPPRDGRMIALRNEEFSEIAKATSEIAKADGAALVAGDMNCTPWSSAFEMFLRDGKLVDTQSGFGPQPSWPAGFSPFPVIPIDHFLTTRNVMTKRRYVCKELQGSDHYPVFIEVLW